MRQTIEPYAQQDYDQRRIGGEKRCKRLVFAHAPGEISQEYNCG
jgi:hypothetical protein